MKKLLFVFMAILAVSISAVAQENNAVPQEIPLEERDKSDEELIEPRSIIFQPITAYLYTNVVSVTFQKNFASVMVSVVNTSTGAVACSETVAYPTALTIDLTAVAAGSYYLVIETDENYWEGNFSLN